MKYSIRAMEEINGDYSDPREAAGMCYVATENIIEVFPGLVSLVADHSNSPMRRFKKLGQYSNHYTPYDPIEDRVYDFTMRQFNPDCGYPFIGTREEWLTELAVAWDTDTIRTGVDCWDLDADELDFISEEEYESFQESIQFWDRASNTFESAA